MSLEPILMNGQPDSTTEEVGYFILVLLPDAAASFFLAPLYLCNRKREAKSGHGADYFARRTVLMVHEPLEEKLLPMRLNGMVAPLKAQGQDRTEPSPAWTSPAWG